MLGLLGTCSDCLAGTQGTCPGDVVDGRAGLCPAWVTISTPQAVPVALRALPFASGSCVTLPWAGRKCVGEPCPSLQPPADHVLPWSTCDLTETTPSAKSKEVNICLQTSATAPPPPPAEMALGGKPGILPGLFPCLWILVPPLMWVKNPPKGCERCQ